MGRGCCLDMMTSFQVLKGNSYNDLECWQLFCVWSDIALQRFTIHLLKC